MAKNIVFCADGTWNGPGQTDTDDPSAPWTNVFKLFLNLAGDDDPGSTQLGKEQERTYTDNNGAVQQVAKYLHGVGDSSNWLDRMLGGGLGVGLITRVVRGYTFISRNYVPGDRIYIVGFSRGAYTARALAGLIADQGLLPPDIAAAADKSDSYRAGAAVWVRWRRDARKAMGQPIDRLDALVLDLPGFMMQPPDPASLVPAQIEAVAVWDTVGALGIPIFTGQHVDADLFQFADAKLSEKVNFGLHAISIDEQREDFTPTLWDPDPARIVQVLFPGAHADVGGGYPLSGGESGLSDGALIWMGRNLRKLGVQFVTSNAAVIPHPNPAGTAHQPWAKPLWAILPRAARTLPPGLDLAKSVIDRINAGAVEPNPQAPAGDYYPQNLANYLVGRQAGSGVAVLNGAQDWP